MIAAAYMIRNRIFAIHVYLQACGVEISFCHCLILILWEDCRNEACMLIEVKKPIEG